MGQESVSLSGGAVGPRDHRPKNPAVALALASVLPLFTVMGAGHWYLGRLWKALTLFVLGWVLVFLWLLFLVASVAVIGETNSTIFLAVDFLALAGYVALWIWQAEDARRRCLTMNARFAAPGPERPSPERQEPSAESPTDLGTSQS